MAQHLFHESHLLALLHDHKLPLALLADLQESVDRHLLDAREGFVHELEEFEDHRLQKLPMGPEEARVLANDVHDVAGHYSLVLLAPLHLAETEKILDHVDKEALLIRLVHGTANGSDGPAKAIQKGRRPVLRGSLCEALLRQSLQHDRLHIVSVEVREVDESLAHHLIERDLIRILLLGPDNVPLLVLLDGNLGGLRHLRNEYAAHLCEDGAVLLLLPAVGVEAVEAGRVYACGAVQQQRRGVAGRCLPTLLHLQEDPRAESLPELNTDLEGLLVRTHGDADEVFERWDHVCLLRLHNSHVVL
mmetsp:Transcript_78298/g.173487  ORF Transcript_78298/g.173487 Transcript_78298/m.173487 type:complete len:304 (-) Transcript_78298:1123-2034(-)